MDGIIFLLVSLLIVGFSIFNIFRSVMIIKKFDKIKKGMDYNQVVSIVGLPKRTETSGDISKCIYSFEFAFDRENIFRRMPRTYRIVAFRNEKVVYIV